MRVLVAGATGVIGTPLVPLLTSVGHDVIALARSADRAGAARSAGAEIAVADALDRAALDRAVRDAAPDAVVNMLTAIPAALDPRKLARQFAPTNRLRTEGTRNLYDAARAAGARRVIAQGLAYAYDPDVADSADSADSADLANEDVPFWPRPARQFAPNLRALTELERLTDEADGLVLRYGHLYGPGSGYAIGAGPRAGAADGSFTAQVRAGKVPLVGGGTAVFSFTHAHDAATAVVAALDKPVRGALNIVDDDPAPVRTWLPALAELLGARPPKAIPAFLARLAVGGFGVDYMTRLRGADNARAKLALDWRPRHASWRTGFAAEAGAAGRVTAP